MYENNFPVQPDFCNQTKDLCYNSQKQLSVFGSRKDITKCPEMDKFVEIVARKPMRFQLWRSIYSSNTGSLLSIFIMAALLRDKSRLSKINCYIIHGAHKNNRGVPTWP